MITQQKAEEIALHWIEAWNSHDINSIMEHYSETVVFSSPLIVKILGIEDGTIHSKQALRDYFIAGLERFPELRFELYHVFTGINSLVIYYKSVNDLVGSEVMFLDDDFKVKSCVCHYKSVASTGSAT